MRLNQSLLHRPDSGGEVQTQEERLYIFSELNISQKDEFVCDQKKHLTHTHK